MTSTPPVPVIALTGHLGAGKTTLLNHVLRTPDARLGVVVNDFGDINVDAALITGQIDEPASIAGGCLCCLVDDDRLDEALSRLVARGAQLDAIVVEASGIAEPGALAAMIRFSGATGVRAGGVIDVVDAVEYFATVDTAADPPVRFASASLVVINKCDRLPPDAREASLTRIEERVRTVNPRAHVVRSSQGRIDPALLFDIAEHDDRTPTLPFAEARRAELGAHTHSHASSVSLRSAAPIDAGRLMDVLEDPPPGAYRMKGRVVVDTGRAVRAYLVNLVGRSIHVAAADIPESGTELVAIGMHLDRDVAERRLRDVLAPAGVSKPIDIRRLQRYRRLSV